MMTAGINERGIDDLISYMECNLAVIPFAQESKPKDGRIHYKRPTVTGWSSYCDELPSEEEIRSWATTPREVKGIGIVCGEASNICCVDIDSEDKKIIERIKKIIPESPLTVKGNRDRGGKLLFRLAENMAKYRMPAQGIYKLKDKKGITACEIFLTKKPVVIPPSRHSVNIDGTDPLDYEWEDKEVNIKKIDWDRVPIFNELWIDAIQMAIIGKTEEEIKMNHCGLDLTEVKIKIEEKGKRWEDMTKLVGGLIKDRTPIETAINRLLEHDRDRNPDDPYFKDKDKNCLYPDRRANAFKLYYDTWSIENKKNWGKNGICKIPKGLGVGDAELKIEESEWGEVIPFTDSIDLEKFNTDLIPENIRKDILEAAEANSVPPQYLFFYMLGCFSSVLGNKVWVEPYKNNSDFKQPCNLYVGIVAASGERKSEITRIARDPLHRLNKKKKAAMKAAIKNSAKINEDLEIKIQSLLKKRKQVIEISDEGPDDEEVIELQKEIDEFIKKKITVKNISLYEQEITAEKLYQVCESNPHGIFLEFNEFGPVYDKLNDRGGENYKSFLLNAHDGNRPFSYKTKQHGDNEIDNLCMSVGFSVQRDVMGFMIEKMLKKDNDKTGLLQRFLIVMSDGEKREAKDVHFKIGEKYDQIFDNAYNIEKSDETVKLTYNSYTKWMKYLNHVTLTEQPNGSIQSFISKFAGQIIRIACNLEHIKNDGNKIYQISDDTYDEAEAIMRYLEKTIHELFKLDSDKRVREVASMIKMRMLPDLLTNRDINRNHLKLFTRCEFTQKSIREKLCKHNYAKSICGRGTVRLKINPLFIEED